MDCTDFFCKKDRKNFLFLMLYYSNMLSEIFWTFLCSSVIGCCLGLGRMIYKSKCKDVKICCIRIIRDTAAEEKIDELRPPSPSPRRSSSNEFI